MKFPVDLLWKPILVTAAVVALMAPPGAALFGSETPQEGGSVLGLVFLTDLLFVAALIFPIRRSTLPRSKLFGAVFLAIFSLNVLLTQSEALFFLDWPAADIARTTFFLTLKAAIVAALATLAFRSPQPVSPSRVADSQAWTTGRWARNVAACAILYVLLYIGVGLLIWPGIRTFYESQQMSVPPLLMPLLGLVRGILYVVLVLPLMRSVAAPRWQVSLSMGLMFPVLAGAFGLLLPNPVMPEAVRLLHMVEISWSNFVFGLIAGAIFWNAAAGKIVRTELMPAESAAAANLGTV
jgi:hypothetical protein